MISNSLRQTPVDRVMRSEKESTSKKSKAEKKARREPEAKELDEFAGGALHACDVLRARAHPRACGRLPQPRNPLSSIEVLSFGSQKSASWKAGPSMLSARAQATASLFNESQLLLSSLFCTLIGFSLHSSRNPGEDQSYTQRIASSIENQCFPSIYYQRDSTKTFT